jgi:hypothetical protein
MLSSSSPDRWRARRAGCLRSEHGGGIRACCRLERPSSEPRSGATLATNSQFHPMISLQADFKSKSPSKGYKFLLNRKLLRNEEDVMKALLIGAITCMILVPEIVTTAQAAPARANRVSVSYVPPKDPAHQPIFTRLKETRFLEKFQEFTSPFRLPRKLVVKLEGCDGDANASYEDDMIIICYEYVDELWRTMPEAETVAGVTRIDTLVGPLFDTCLHEFAHALFDMLRVPVLGREEDAADQVSAYIMLHLGKAEARRLIGGTAYAYKTEAAANGAPTFNQFANEHGTPAQRFFNLLCIAYGADAQLFGDVVEKGFLPKDRAESCDDEYQQVTFAYQKLIGPYIDNTLAKKVFGKSWLPDAKKPVPRRIGSAQPK